MRKLVLLATLVFALSALAAEQRLTIDQYFDFVQVSAPEISPDGSLVAYTRRVPDKVNDKYESEIWLVNADGSHNRFFAKGANAAWAPDGKRIAYVADGKPSGSQIFVKWVGDAEDTQVTRLERSPSRLAWSPDGKRIAFTMIVPPSAKELTIKMPERPSGAKWIDPPRVIGRLNYRSDGSGWSPEGFTHVFTVSAEGGIARQVTSGDFNDGAPEWTPDSRSIVFSGRRRPNAEYVFRESDIYIVPADGGEPRALTDRRGPDDDPIVSPDGKLIAYTGFDQTPDTYRTSKLYVMNADGSNKRTLTDAFDRTPNAIHWSPDGSGIYFVTEDRGSQNVWFEAIAGGAPHEITSGAQIVSVRSISRNGLIAATITSPQAPADVWVVPVANAKSMRRVTHANDELFAGRRLGEVEEIWYDSQGQKIQGWLVKPPAFDASKKYPLVLSIHGGPHNMYGTGFNFEFQNHAANDYVVLYTNPRGSTGYGTAFGNAINNNYPGPDYDDLMAGVDAVIKRGYVDEKNVYVYGGSGGGVLTSWIVGHTNRFTAAVVMKPVVNWYSFVGTTDFAEWYDNFRERPWVNPEEHIRRSPITYVAKVKTPTMLLTGDIDLRTPLEQTEQYYRALKMQHVDTLMIRLADEYHGMNSDAASRHPSNRIAQMLYVRAWFEKHKR